MRRSDFETLSARQKAYEMRDPGSRLMPGLPFLMRFDGHGFGTFTKSLKGPGRPYDERLSHIMIELTKHLVRVTHATVGYTQSDEITLGFPNLDLEAQMLHGGRVQKLLSLYPSHASSVLKSLIFQRLPEKAHLNPVFDAKVWSVPRLELATESFLYRETDATRNSLMMAARAYYPSSELHKASLSVKHDMLHAKGVNWNDYPPFFKRGTYVRKESVMKAHTEVELAKIPVEHRPNGPILRSVLQEMELPPASRVANLQEVLFFGALPQTLERSDADAMAD